MTVRKRKDHSKSKPPATVSRETVESSAEIAGVEQRDEVKDAEADAKALVVKADAEPLSAKSEATGASSPSKSESPLTVDESYDEIESDEIESEDDNGKELMLQQFGHLLHKHSSARRKAVEDVDFIPSLVRGLYPPLADASFEFEVKVLTMHVDVADAIKMMDPTSGGTPTVARRRHSHKTTAEKLKGAAKVFSSFSAGASSPALVSRRRGVSVLAVYSRKGLDAERTTGKFDSLEFDANIVHIRESFAFELDMDDDNADGRRRATDEHVAGRINFEVKESHGALSKTKSLGFGTFKVEEAIGEGMISRRGDWTEINLPLTEMHKSKFTALKKKLRKRGGKAPQRPVEVGTLLLRCRLHWTEEVVAAFVKQVSERRVAKSGTLRRKEVFAEMDLFYLLTHRSTTLRLTVLAVLFDVEALGEWDTDDTVRLIRELRETGTHSTVFADAIEDTLVSGTYQCRDRLRTKRTPAHSSKNADVLFIGETLAFKLKPFAPELADAREADAGGDWHPQVRFQRDEATKQPPGSVQLAVDRKSQRIGAALFLLRDMLPHAAVADSLASNKHLFVLPVFQWLPAAQCLADAVQTKVALMFCIGQFLWDEQ